MTSIRWAGLSPHLSTCLDAEELAAALDGAPAGAPLSRSVVHLWTCPACRALAREVARCRADLDRERPDPPRLPVC